MLKRILFLNCLIYFFSCCHPTGKENIYVGNTINVLRCSASASYGGGFSCGRAQALGVWASVVAEHGLNSWVSQALEHRLNSCGAGA